MRTARALTVVPVLGGGRSCVLGDGCLPQGQDHLPPGQDHTPWTGPPPPNHVTYPMMHLMSCLPPSPKVEQTDACENITFARFTTRAVRKPEFATH